MAAIDTPADAPGPRPSRSLATAYLVWFLVGALGGHRFYLGDGRGGRRYLLALGLGVLLPVVGLGIALTTRTFEGVAIGLIGFIAGLLVLLGVLLMVLIDAFRLPGMTRRANSAMAGGSSALATPEAEGGHGAEAPPEAEAAPEEAAPEPVRDAEPEGDEVV